MADISIKAEGVGKQYIIGGAELQYESFRELLLGTLISPFKKFKTLSGHVAADRQFWALKDLGFEISEGEVVGVIGHNGAGKSTLLKILSRITSPTTGQIEISGRVASLLEVGTGFHPELTGRENIYLNGSILGMPRAQIDAKFDEIVEFADVTQFLDTPVKRYSSGMGVRLAFSVAAHLETDVLLVDEVLAVGDQKFQEKCLGKLENVGLEGRTVLFVSHNLASVAKLCSRVIVMDHGGIAFDGDVTEGISFYNRQVQNSEILIEKDFIGHLYPTVSFDQFKVQGSAFQEGQNLDPFDTLELSLGGVSQKTLSGYRSVFSVRKDGQLIFSLYDSSELTELPQGRFESRFVLPAKLLLPGEYTCSFGGISDDVAQWLWTRNYRFHVSHRWADDYDTTSTVQGAVNVLSAGSRVFEAESQNE